MTFSSKYCLIIIFWPILFDQCEGQNPLIVTVYKPWGTCGLVRGSLDRNCNGTQSRVVQVYDNGTLVSSTKEPRDCLMTTDVIDGGFTLWTEWEDCAKKCSGKTYKYRTCNNPTPCNGGEDCQNLGNTELKKNCGPISGQWGDWGSWGGCVMSYNTSSLYGPGTYIRYRKCNNPAPICDGDDCLGSDSMTRNCRVVPPCLTPKIFDEKFLSVDTPMEIYKSAQVDIYLLTKNKCAPGTIVYNYFDLFKINETSGLDTRIRNRLWNSKFSFEPGTLDIGLYRLHSRIGYPNKTHMEHWMEESMFVRIVHPPPHAFIKGGAARTVGKGQTVFDARSVSYSLNNGPGDPSGLTFEWRCLNFVTKSIYSLLQFNIDPVKAFSDEDVDRQKWYETSFLENIENQMAFLNVSVLFERINYLRKRATSCNDSNNIFVKTKSTFTTALPFTTEDETTTSEMPSTYTTADNMTAWNSSMFTISENFTTTQMPNSSAYISAENSTTSQMTNFSNDIFAEYMTTTQIADSSNFTTSDNFTSTQMPNSSTYISTENITTQHMGNSSTDILPKNITITQMANFSNDILTTQQIQNFTTITENFITTLMPNSTTDTLADNITATQMANSSINILAENATAPHFFNSSISTLAENMTTTPMPNSPTFTSAENTTNSQISNALTDTTDTLADNVTAPQMTNQSNKTLGENTKTNEMANSSTFLLAENIKTNEMANSPTLLLAENIKTNEMANSSTILLAENIKTSEIANSSTQILAENNKTNEMANSSTFLLAEYITANSSNDILIENMTTTSMPNSTIVTSAENITTQQMANASIFNSNSAENITTQQTGNSSNDIITEYMTITQMPNSSTYTSAENITTQQMGNSSTYTSAENITTSQMTNSSTDILAENITTTQMTNSSTDILAENITTTQMTNSSFDILTNNMTTAVMSNSSILTSSENITTQQMANISNHILVENITTTQKANFSNDIFAENITTTLMPNSSFLTSAENITSQQIGNFSTDISSENYTTTQTYNFSLSSNETVNMKTADTSTYDISTTEEPLTTTIDNTPDVYPLSAVYNILYMYEMIYYPKSKKHQPTIELDLVERSGLDKRIEAEMFEFIESIFSQDGYSLSKDATDFIERISESALTIKVLYELHELPGLPESADEQFFNDLQNWLRIADEAKYLANQLVDALNNLEGIRPYIDRAKELIEYIWMDGYFQLDIYGTGSCLLDYLGIIFEGFAIIDNFDWNEMKLQERYYLKWLEDELFFSSACNQFIGLGTGTASLNVTEFDAFGGIGFLVYVKVEFEKSSSYFIQHVQSIRGNPPSLDVECKLNCMKKTALTSILSLKAKCMTCTYEELLGIKVWWDIKNFDPSTRKTSNNTEWQNWMLTDIDKKEFVMRANVLNASSGYLVETFMELSTGEISTSIWVLTTNILPYGGSCVIENADRGEKKVITSGWNDEGFRSALNPAFDWKEQLNYRIVQVASSGKETLLYYGFEEENYITVNPGSPDNNYDVEVKVQVYDIFSDYTECIKDLGQVLPDYTTGNDASVSRFLDQSSISINYYWRTGNVKQVAMNTEVAGSPVSNLNGVPTTIFETDPADWVELGVEKHPDGTISTKSFDELWDLYENPDQGDVSSLNAIMNKVNTFTSTLDKVSDAVDGTSTVNLEQIAKSIGTVVNNKKYTLNSSASNAFKGSKKLVDKLIKLAYKETYPKYEDYISTCEGVLRVLNNALEALLPQVSVDTPSQLDIYTVMNNIADRQTISQANDEDLADLTLLEKAFIAAEIAKKNKLEAELKNEMVKNEVQTLLESIATLGDVIHMLNDRKQLPVNVQNGHINSTREKKLIAELVTSGIENNGVLVNFKESDSRSTQEQNVQVNVYDHTPFSWDEESKYISSQTVTIDVGDGNNTNTAIPSKIRIPNSIKNTTGKTVVLAVSSESVSQMLIYSMHWKTPTDSLIFSINGALNHLDHVIYARKKKPPTQDEYDWKKDIESSDWISSNEIKVMIPSGLYSEASLIQIGVSVSSANTSPQARRKRSTVSTTEYQLTGVTTGCRVWDNKAQIWNKTSCQLSPDSTVNETICECANPPGNSFATTFYVPPNTIDFSSVFSKFNLKDNAAVFSTVICLIVVYLLICVWAYRQDKQDHDRWALSYLVDNSPTDDYLYILTVYTGLYRQAGTKSNISFHFFGGTQMNIQTAVRRLDDETRKGFGVGSVRRFVMSMPKRLEDPSVLRIWHDSSGPGDLASWYLNKIILEDVQTQDSYEFVCEQWLSLDHDDGMVECMLSVSDKDDRLKFKYLFNEKTRENTTDNHLWLSVAIRPEESNFTRVQRLACCLTYLFLAMISNAMFFGQDTGSKLSLGPITFSLSGIYISIISAVIAAPPIFFVTYLFRNSRSHSNRIRSKTENDENRQKHDIYACELPKDHSNVNTYSERLLPFWCKYIAWTIATIAILASGFFLILYSMEWGKTKSEEWLLCFFMSFFESLLIIDPLKIILISLILSWIIKSHKNRSMSYDVQTLLEETKQRAATRVLTGNDVQQIRVAPLKPSRINKLKEKRKATIRAQRTLTEVILYLIFLIFLYLVSFSNRDTEWSILTQHLDKQLITVPEVLRGYTSFRFSQVKSAADINTWLNETLVKFLFPRYYVNNDPMRANQRLYVNDLVNFRVGPMIIRQVRIKQEKCKLQLWDDIVCYDSYSVLDEEDRDYCVGWENGPCPRGQEVYNKTSSAWTFVSALDVWGLPVTGYRSTYGGGGYMAEFIVNYNMSKLILDDLYKYMWIDRKTRAVFAEFTLYNVNDNVFVYCTFLCELPNTGGVLTKSSIQPFRPYQHVGSYGAVVLVCELIVFVCMVIFAIRKILMFRSHGRQVLKEVWNVLDLCIIILFIVCTVMYIGRWIMINRAIDKFETNKNKFVNFGHIATWDELFNIILAFIIFLTTLRIMRVLSYNERMNQLGYVLSDVSRELAGCFLLFLIVYTSFVTFGYLIFGRQLATYKNLFVSSTTLTNALVGKNSIYDLFDIEPVIGRIYYFFFVLFMLWILMTMLNATLNVGITRVRQKIVHIPPSFGIINVLINLWKTTLGLFSSTNDFNADDYEKRKTYNKDLSKALFNIKDESTTDSRKRQRFIFQ